MKKISTALNSMMLQKQDLVCFSHLRWDFVYQRPQHLMSRFAKKHRVFFIEEPVHHDEKDTYALRLANENVWVVTPLLKKKVDNTSEIDRQKKLLNKLFKACKINDFIAWYYTPMALKVTTQFTPKLCVYDCMDELSAFKFAPVELKLLERELFAKASIVFTGGQSLYEAKKHSHNNIFLFKSSIDKQHFLQARTKCNQPTDQVNIPSNRFGFYGVIDERFDIKLINDIAEKRPDWQMILIGPVVKINEADLPKRSNIHYLGNKSYNELPQYLNGWDIAMIPFAKNESTKFISPTKTPEYLCAAKPVISTSITDVVNPYGNNNLVGIADDADSFIEIAEKMLAQSVKEYSAWLSRVDTFLADISWDKTAEKMMDIMDESVSNKDSVSSKKTLRTA